MIKIIVSEQKLYHRRRTGVVCEYPISTAAKGVGNQSGTYQTPLGRHKVKQKIGIDAPIYSAFVARQVVGVFSEQDKLLRSDWILSRILWLEGQQTGLNKRGSVDTFHRYIYIHGTDEEDKIGMPSSHGCIRMKNEDVIDLFEHSFVGETVYIKP